MYLLLLCIEYSTQYVRERDIVYVLDKWLHPQSFYLYSASIPLTVHLRHCRSKMINTAPFRSNITYDTLSYDMLFLSLFPPSVCKRTVRVMGSLVDSLSLVLTVVRIPALRHRCSEATSNFVAQPHSARCSLFMSHWNWHQTHYFSLFKMVQAINIV